MSTAILQPCLSKDIDGKKKKKKTAKLVNVGDSKVDEKATEVNVSLKEENDLPKKKKEKKHKLETEKKSETSLTGEIMNTKDKKKKKNKRTSDVIDENNAEVDAEVKTREKKSKKETDEKKKKKKNKTNADPVVETNAEVEAEVDPREKKPKKETNEKKKKDKNKTTTDTLTGNSAEVDAEVNAGEKKTKKEKKNKVAADPLIGNNAEVNVEVNKIKKKKKKETKEKKNKTTTLIENDASDDAEVNTREKKTKKETKEKKNKTTTDPLVENNDTIDEVNSQMTKKRKRSDENDGQHAEEIPVQDAKRRKPDGLVMNGEKIVANGEITQNDHLELTKSATVKSGPRQPKSDSAEPKTVNAFQRVKIDEVEFVDDRLQDNSYWAKLGAEKGYGAKAQEILGQVKGRDFRHEKTKKKRGSYRGGQIDLDSHSIKFNYSDEE